VTDEMPVFVASAIAGRFHEGFPCYEGFVAL